MGGAGLPAGAGAGAGAGGDAGRHERNLVALRKQLTGHGADHSRISDEKLKPYLQHIITKIPPQNHRKAVEKLAQNIMRQQVGSTGGASNMGGGARLSQTGGAYTGQASAGSGIGGKYTFGLTNKPTGGPRISPAADNLTMSPYKVADRQASAGGGISFGLGDNRSVNHAPPSPSLGSKSLANIERERPEDRDFAAYNAYKMAKKHGLGQHRIMSSDSLRKRLTDHGFSDHSKIPDENLQQFVNKLNTIHPSGHEEIIGMMAKEFQKNLVDAPVQGPQMGTGVGSGVNFIPHGHERGLSPDIHTNSPQRPAVKWDDEHQVANGNFLSSPSSMGGISFSSGAGMRKR
jgi:hypothetical protein